MSTQSEYDVHFVGGQTVNVVSWNRNDAINQAREFAASEFPQADGSAPDIVSVVKKDGVTFL